MIDSLDDAYPLNEAHKGILFHSLRSENTDVYQSVISMTLSGDLKLEVLKRAWQRVFDHHPALRCGVIADGVAEPLWAVRRTIDPQWQVLDFTGYDTHQCQEEELAIVRDLEEVRFQFTGDELLRFTLIVLSDNRYRLLWTVHHLISDGWSTAIILEDLITAYQTCKQGLSKTLDPALSYREFLNWQDQQSDELLKQYWKNYLSGKHLTPLRYLDPVSEDNVKDNAATHTTLTLDTEKSNGVYNAAKAYRTTNSALLLAAWALVLRELSQHESPLFGVTVAGRPAHLPGIERSVGLFAATLPLSVDTGFSPLAIEKWLSSVAITVQAHTEHATLGLSEMQKLIEREVTVPMFDTVVSIGGHDSGMTFGTSEAEGIHLHSVETRIRSHFDLSLLITTADTIGLHLIAQTDALNESNTKQILASYASAVDLLTNGRCDTVESLCRQWIAYRKQPFETQQKVRATAYHRIEQWIWDVAKRQPNTDALIQGAERINYAELMKRALDVSRSLNVLSQDQSLPVAIVLPNSIDAVVVMMGVLMSGRFYVPVDPTLPDSRLVALCRDAGCDLVIVRNKVQTDSILCEDEAHSLKLVTLSVLTSPEVFEESQPDNITGSESTLAYLMYTSGSTGVPKGVPLSHANLLYSTRARLDYYPEKVERFLLVSPLNFDSSVVGVYWTLCSGGTVVLPDTKYQRDLSHWSTLIKENSISHLLCLPSVYRLLLQSATHVALNSLKTVIVAGERCDGDLCTLHYEYLPNATMYNEYGPTEACVWSSAHRCEAHESVLVPIGLPIPGTAIGVIGIDGAPCPDGIEGELVISSDGVAAGYHGHPELTLERFERTSSTYKTGDLGYRSVNGQYYCTGRLDRQIKVNGQRIEPAEIESAARLAEGIDSARAFMASATQHGASRLWLAYTPATVNSDVIARVLSKKLAASMMPFGYLALGELPTLPNGKVSETALAQQVVCYQGQAEGSCAQTKKSLKERHFSDTENALLDTASTLLGQSVSLSDNLLQRGLDSFASMKLTTELRKRFEVNLKLVNVLEAENCQALANIIQQLQHREKVYDSGSGRAEPAAEIPLSKEQSQLWYLEQMGLQPEVYAVQSSFRWTGVVSLPAIAYSLDALIHRHEILRTRLRVNADGIAFQLVCPPEPVTFQVIDAKHQDITWTEVCASQLKKQFDLANDQLLRAVLYRLDEQDSFLMLHSHHIVLDRWSINLLHKQFAAYYGQYVNSRRNLIDEQSATSSLAMPEPDAHQYRDFALWQQNRNPEDLQLGINHWTKILAEPREQLHLPIDKPRPSRQTYTGSSFIRKINPDTVAHWQEITQHSKATLFTVTLAAVKTALRRVCRCNDLLIGTPVTNREEPNWQKTLGFFSNTVVVRTSTDASNTFLDVVSTTRTATLEALRYPSVSLGEILPALNAPRASNRHPLFDVFFMFSQDLISKPDLPEVAIEVVTNSSLEGAKFDLGIEICPDNALLENGYQIHLNYNTDLFSVEAIESLCGEMLRVMAATAQHPDIPIIDVCSDKPPVPSTDHLIHYQDGLVTNKTLDQVFAEMCHRVPENTALLQGDESIDYATLNKQVDKIATCLMESGVIAGDIVALSLPRSVHQIAAALAVSRCSAAWCPIDPSYPNERKQFILSDSTARFLITQSTDINSENDLHGILKIGIDVDLPIQEFQQPTVNGEASKPDSLAATRRYKNSTAVLIYTSGSTGTPKGVLLGNRSLMNRFVWMWTQYPYSEDDINAIKTSCSFVDALWESFGALLAGVPSVLIGDEEVLQIERFVQILHQQQVTRLLLVPSLLSALVHHLEGEGTSLPDLRMLSCSGEVLPAALARRILTIQPGTRLLNLYGSTEVTADASCQEIVSINSALSLSLGTAITGVNLHVLDEQQRLMPANKAGEIAISGQCLAISYHNDDAQTQQKFINIEKIGRVFLTGDHGRLDELCRLSFEGRKDRQVKVRGVRVDCHEVEHQLQSLDAVAHCCVFARGELDDNRLCAVIERSPVTKLSATIDVKRSIQKQLGELVPEHQIPDVFVLVDELPKLFNGKTDRGATRELTIDNYTGNRTDSWEQEKGTPAQKCRDSSQKKRLHYGSDSGTPLSMVEPMLKVWRSILRMPSLSADDDFFENGGYSLLAIKLIAQMNREILTPLGVNASIVDLVEYRCVSEMASQMKCRFNEKRAHDNTHSQDSLMVLRSVHGCYRMFVIPPFGHTGFFLKNFVTEVPSNISVYSFDTSTSLKHDTLEKLCSEFVEHVMNVQPKGPWVIVGLCLGSVLAFEMASQLKTRTGFESDLFLVDGNPPLSGPGWIKNPNPLDNLSPIPRYWRILRNEFVNDYCRRIVERRIRKFQALYNEGIQRYFDVQAIQGDQYEQYRGSCKSAKISLILTSTFMSSPERVERWRSLTTGSFRTIYLPDVTHLQLVRSNSSRWDKVISVILGSHCFKFEPNSELLINNTENSLGSTQESP